MAELLIKNKASYQGDIIIVRPDGWAWGDMECLPDYVVVKIPDKYKDVKHYEFPVLSVDKNGNVITVEARKRYISEYDVHRKAAEVKDFKNIIPVELGSKILSRAENDNTIT